MPYELESSRQVMSAAQKLEDFSRVAMVNEVAVAAVVIDLPNLRTHYEAAFY